MTLVLLPPGVLELQIPVYEVLGIKHRASCMLGKPKTALGVVVIDEAVAHQNRKWFLCLFICSYLDEKCPPIAPTFKHIVPGWWRFGEVWEVAFRRGLITGG